MKHALVGISKGGRDPIVLATISLADEFWRIEGDFLVTYRIGAQWSRARRIPAHIDSIEAQVVLE